MVRRTLLFGLVLASLSAAEEVERVLALVDGVPILASDVELATMAGLVPRQPGEEEEAYRQAVLEALIALRLRYADLARAQLVARTAVDLEAAWNKMASQAGGEEHLLEKLAAAGFSAAALRALLRQAAVVEAYAARRFASAVRVGGKEVEELYHQELVPALAARGVAPPPLEQVRGELEALARERAYAREVERWTQELAQRAEIIRYLR